MPKSINAINSSDLVNNHSDRSAASSDRRDLSYLIGHFLQFCEVDKNLSQGTVKMYHLYLTLFLQWSLAYFNKKNISYQDITQDVIRDFRIYLNRRESDKRHNETIKRNTQNRYLTALRSFFRYLIIEMNYDDALSPDKIILGKQDPRTPKFLTPTQVHDMFRVQDLNKNSGIRDRAILETLFSTGLRISELTNLNRSDISPAILEKREFAVVGKGRKLRTVYLSKSASDWLRRYMSTRKDNFKPLFVRYSGKAMDPTDEDGESLRITPRSVQRLVKSYSVKAGISVNVTPHVMRHSFATDLLSSGADLRSVQELLGHSDVSTTQIYTHVTNKQLKDIHDKFHSE